MNEILIEAFRQKDWATKALIAACADRSVDELTRPAPGFGSILATRALSVFLTHANPTRPIYARAAKDNIGSLRVLEKCGFKIIGEDRGFANARGKEIGEFLLELC